MLNICSSVQDPNQVLFIKILIEQVKEQRNFIEA